MKETKHENRQTIETMGTWFSEESFIDKSFLLLGILRGAYTSQIKRPW